MIKRPLVVDMEALNADRPRRQRAWWEECTDEEFREELDRQTEDELRSLISELNAAVASTAQVVNNVNLDHDWRRRAQRALPRLTQRRSILAAKIRDQDNAAYLARGEERDRIVNEVRAMALDGDVQGALLRLLDWVQSFGRQAEIKGRRRTDGRRSAESERKPDE